MSNELEQINARMNGRLGCLYTLFFFMVLGLIVRIIFVQFVSDGPQRNLAALERNVLQKHKIQAHRGSILARDGRPFVMSVFRYKVTFDIASDGLDNSDRFFSEAEKLSRKLSEYFNDKSASEYYKLLTDRYDRRIDKKYIGADTVKTYSFAPSKVRWLYRLTDKFLGTSFGQDSIVEKYRHIRQHSTIELFPPVSMEEWEEIRTFPILNGSLGVVFKRDMIDTRLYPFDDLALRVVGRVSETMSNPYGMEFYYQDSLKGRDGYEWRQSLAPGLSVRIEGDPKHPNQDPVNGYDIVTTIDIDLQQRTMEILKRQLIEKTAEGGTTIVMDVTNGDILAMANLTKNRKDGKYIEAKNHALGMRFEPGSTMKLATAIALLDGKNYSPNKLYDSGHGKQMFVGGMKVRDASDDGGVINMWEAFQRSANVYFVKAVYDYFGTCPRDYVRIMRHLQLDRPLNLGEMKGANPTFKDPDVPKPRWSHKTTLLKMSYGYEIEITPLRLVTLYAGMANHGKMMEPRIVKRIERDGKVFKKDVPNILEDSICSQRTRSVILEMMANVAKDGTARQYFGEKIVPFKAGAKTGTAQFTQGHSIAEGYYVGSMMAIFPIDNPKYAIYTAVIKKHVAAHDYYGAGLAGPVEHEVAMYLYNHDKDFRKRPEQYSAEKPNGKTGNVERMNSVYSALGFPAVLSDETEWYYKGADQQLENVETQELVVPNVMEMGLMDAVYLLEKAGLKVSFRGKGKVTYQSRQAGEPFNKGDKIEIVLSL